MRLKFPAAAVGALLAAMPAAAQSVADDVRCMIASNVFATAEKDPQRKQLAGVARVFYIGRVDARLSPEQLKTQVLAQGKTLNAQNLGQVMTDCAKRLATKEQQMQALGKEIAAAAQAQQPAAPPPAK